MKKNFKVILLAGFICGLVAFEDFCRRGLGLGDPPLFQTHPMIEYIHVPSQQFTRFGNRFTTNAYSMRSSEFPAKRQDNEIRIMIYGDSIQNGGNQTDQSELATEIIKSEIEATTSVPVIVGNISAPSWSPPNFLAYINEYGTFDADIAVVILNDGDLTDLPNFEPLDPKTHPTKAPPLASIELFERYLVPKILKMLSKNESNTETKAIEVKEDSNCSPQLLEVIQALKADGAEVFLFYHPSAREMDTAAEPHPICTDAMIIDFAINNGMTLYGWKDLFVEFVNSGGEPYRDSVHPNSEGQKLIARKLINVFQEQGLLNQWNARK